ncbi:hypothetical protein LENED_007731 [Lentinula edodes]|uniref:Uncharacterized protein n=1 Tax=Lentinula edodes TaxID=5353 RepID=A0A1Q3EF83_LENED|nr:hypothetical protein LENED_007731 [Lentinula edodes]
MLLATTHVSSSFISPFSLSFPKRQFSHNKGPACFFNTSSGPCRSSLELEPPTLSFLRLFTCRKLLQLESNTENYTRLDG